MSEIRFRGKSLENDIWVTGSLVNNSPKGVCYIVADFDGDEDSEDFCAEKVIPSTVGQYIGLNDKNGFGIYDGDVCRYYNSEDKDGVAIIKDGFARWVSGTISTLHSRTPLHYLQCSSEWEVIGNVHDNPELLDK